MELTQTWPVSDSRTSGRSPRLPLPPPPSPFTPPSSSKPPSPPPPWHHPHRCRLEAENAAAAAQVAAARAKLELSSRRITELEEELAEKGRDKGREKYFPTICVNLDPLLHRGDLSVVSHARAQLPPIPEHPLKTSQHLTQTLVSVRPWDSPRTAAGDCAGAGQHRLCGCQARAGRYYRRNGGARGQPSRREEVENRS